jgi:hypothetical protein
MIGVGAAQRSCCIAFAFLSGETEEDYTWALERLKSLCEQLNTFLPSLILTDRCLAVMSASFPFASGRAATSGRAPHAFAGLIMEGRMTDRHP